ncbi:hypothetical protein EV361DRAFT_11418 [Lentinula raphanica]|uniref:Uncharacterized protein n=1 Tax=Lentinula raphanica TaxID=153919 RepID=A0AA38P2Q6_9AGAR|nr:hypothetical protein F5878DRAFT_323992 [Lentinula raphanica]KAJ3964985.1 hypothetical protein EV361DRAFT_11418 [Lentinula raphanica]
MALLSFLRLLPAILLLRPVLMAPPFIPGIPPGTGSSGASESAPASGPPAFDSGSGPAPGYAARTPSGYADTGSGPAPGYAARTPSGYADTGSADTRRYYSAPGYAPVGSGYVPGHTRAALGYASVAPGYASAPGSVPPGSSAVKASSPTAFKLPSKEQVIDFPVYFVAMYQNGQLLKEKQYHSRWNSQRVVGLQIGHNVAGRFAERDSTGSMTISPGRATPQGGLPIGTLKFHFEKGQVINRMWEETEKTTFTSQLDFLQKTERKLKEIGEELKREDPESGWEQSKSEKEKRNSMFAKVEEMERELKEKEEKDRDESKGKRKDAGEEEDRKGKKRRG